MRRQFSSGGAGSDASRRAPSGRRSARTDVFPRLYASQLEPRIVLNGAPIVQLDASGVLTVGSGAAGGDGVADTFQLTFSDSSGAGAGASGGTGASSATIEVSVNDGETMSIAADQVRSIQILGSSDVDSVALDAELVDRFSVTLDGASATSGRDTLSLNSDANDQWSGLSVDVDATGGQLQLTRADGVLSAGLNFTGTIDVIDSLTVSDRQISISGGTSVTFIGDGDRLGVESNQGSMLTTSLDRAHWQINATGADVSVIGRADVDGLTIDAGIEGRIEVSGEVDASRSLAGSVGGSVQLRAGEVTLTETALIDVSGANGGGRIEVGGTLQGQSDGSPNSQRTVVESGSRLIADATDEGDGGTVIIWSDEITAFAGTISARGAASSGDGGFVEVSGKERLWMRGQVDTSATNGNMGTLLLDPTAINIVESADGSGTLDNQLSAIDMVIDSGDPSAELNTVSTGQLQAFTEGSNVILAATGDVTIEDLASDALTLTLGPGLGGIVPRGSLTLTSTTGAVIFAGANDVIDTGGGSLIINAATNITLNANVLTGGGDIVLVSAGSITTADLSGNAIRLQGTDVTTGALTASNATASTYAVDIDSTTLDVQGGILANTAAAGGVVRIAGNLASDLSVDLTGGANRLGDFVGVGEIAATTVGGASLAINTNGGDIHFAGDVSDLSGLSISNATTVTLQNVEIDGSVQVAGTNILLEGASLSDRSAAGTMTLTGDLTLATDVTLSAEASIEVNGRIDSADAPATPAGLNIQSELGTVLLSGEIGSVSALAGLNVLSTDLSIDAIGTSSDAGIIGDTELVGSDSITLLSQTYHTGGSLTFTGPVSVSGALGAATLQFTTDASDADLRFDDDVVLPGIAILDAGGDLTFAAALTTSDRLQVSGDEVRFAGDTTVTGAVSVNAQNTLTVEADIDATGPILLQANQDNTDSEGFVQTSGSVIESTAGSSDAIEIAVGGSGGAQIASLRAGAGSVTVTAGGAIVDDGDISADVVANSLILNGNSNVQLDTDIATLTANLGVNGGLDIDNEGNLTIDQVGVTDGSAVISATALTVDEISVSDALTLIARTGGISDANAGSMNVIANELNIESVNDVNLDTDINELSATISGTGNLSLENRDELTIDQVAVVDGSAVISATTLTVNEISVSDDLSLIARTGGISDGNAEAMNVTANELNIESVDNVNLDTNVNELSATFSGTGNLSLANQGGLTIGQIALGGGFVNLNATAFVVGDISTTGDVTLVATSGGILDDNLDTTTVTADTLTLSSASTVDLDTDAATIDLTMTGTGDVTLDQSSRALVMSALNVPSGDVTIDSEGEVRLSTVTLANKNLTVSGSDITAADDIVGVSDLVVTATGEVEFLQVVSIAQTVQVDADGDVAFRQSASSGGSFEVEGDNVRFDESITAGGAITITAANELRLSDDLDAGDQRISLTANADGIGTQMLVQTGGVIQTTSTATDALTIQVDGEGDLTLTNLEVLSGGIQLIAGGQVTGDGSPAVDIQSVSLSVEAGNGINLVTDVRSLSGFVTGAGDIVVDSFGDVNVLRLETTDGSIQMTSVGTATLTEVIAGANGNIDLSSNTGSIVSASGATGPVVQGGDLTVNAATGVRLQTDVEGLSGGVSGTGDFEITDQSELTIGQITLGGGLVSLNATAFVVGDIATTGDVTLVATSGGILDDNLDTTTVTANTLTLSSASTVDLDTDAATIDLTMTGTGDVTLDQSSRALVMSALNVPSGDVTIDSEGEVRLSTVTLANKNLTVSGSDITAADDIVGVSDLVVTATGEVEFLQVVSIAQTVQVDADGDVAFRQSASSGGSFEVEGDNVRFDESITAGGAITITAANELRLSDDLDAGDQRISLTANTDGIGSQMLVQTGGVIRTTSTATDALTIQIDGEGDLTSPNLEVLSGGIQLIAGGQITGDGSPAVDIQSVSLSVEAGNGINLVTDVRSLSGFVTGAGDIVVVSFGDVDVLRLETTDGSIQMTSVGTATLTEVIAGTNGNIDLRSNTGSIVSASGVTGPVVQGGDLTVNAATGVRLQTDVEGLSGGVSGTGDFEITDQSELTVDSVSVADGVIRLTAETMNVGAVTAPGMVFLTTTVGSIRDANGGLVNVTASQLNVNSIGSVDLDTDIDTVSVAITGTGDLDLSDDDNLQVNSIAVDDGKASISATQLGIDVITASERVTLVSRTGQITDLNGSLLNVTAPTLEIQSASDVELDTNIDALQANITGNLLIRENNAIRLDDVTLSLGNASVEASSIDVVSITGATETTLIASAGSILGNADGSVDITGGRVTARATHTIQLETQVDSADLESTTAGNVEISDSADLFVDRIVVNNGNAIVTADQILVNQVTASNDVTMTSRNGGVTDNNGAAVNVTAATLIIDSSGHINLDTTVDAVELRVTGAGNIDLHDTDSLAIDVATTDSGNVTITATEMTVDDVSASGVVRLEATSGGMASVASGSPIVVADQLVAIATSGIDLNTRVTVADLTVSGVGDLRINETDGIDVTRLNVADGDATVISGAGLTLMRDVTVTNGNLEVQSSGDVTFNGLASSGGVLSVSGDNITVQTVSNVLGAVEITALNRLQVNNGIDAGNYQVRLHANQDNSGSEGFVQSQLGASIRTNLTTANAVDIQVGGDGDASIWDVQASNGGVVIDAGGRIADYGDAAANIVAQSLNLVAGNGVMIGTAVNTISASVSDGDIVIAENDAVRLQNVTASNGNINITNSTGTMEVASVNAQAGDVQLTALDGAVIGIGSDATHVRGINLLANATAGVQLRTDVVQVSGTVTNPGSHFEIQQHANLRVADLDVRAGDAIFDVENDLVLANVTVSNALRVDAVGSVSGGASSGPDVTADQLIARTDRGVELETAVNSVDVTVSGEGNVRIQDRDSLTVNRVLANDGDIAITAMTGEARIQGEVIAASGQIELTATSGDLRFANPVAGSQILISSSGPNASIRSSAGANVLMEGPGIVLFQTPQSQYFNVMPDLRVDPINRAGLGDIQVGFDGVADLNISFGLPVGPAETFFVLTVHWGDQTETYTNANTTVGDLYLQRAGAAAGSELVFTLTHQYFSNPTVGDATAPIPILVTASNSGPGGSAADITFFANGDETTPLSSMVEVVLNVPGSGLATVGILVTAVEIPDEPLEVEPLPEPVLVRSTSADTSQSTEPLMIRSEAPIAYERYYVLRIVVLLDETGATHELEDIRIDDAEIKNLPGLFEKLPDDRYRLYQVREDGVAQMITDVVVRGGKSAGNVEFDEDWTVPAEQDQDPTVEPRTSPNEESAPANRERSSEDLGAWRSFNPGVVITRTGLVIRPSNEFAHQEVNHENGVSASVPPSLSAVSDQGIEASLPMAWRWRMSQRIG